MPCLKCVKSGVNYPKWAMHGMGNLDGSWHPSGYRRGGWPADDDWCGYGPYAPSSQLPVLACWQKWTCADIEDPTPLTTGTDPGRVRTQNRRWSLTKIEGIAGCFCRLYPEDQQTKGESLVIVSMGSLMEPPMGISWIEKLCISAILAAFCNASMSIFFKWNAKGI